VLIAPCIYEQQPFWAIVIKQKGDFVKTFKALFLSIAMSFCIIASVAALSNSLFAAPQGQAEQSKGQGLVQVEAKYVCMINNQRFNKEQIPVAVGKLTYYGCCEMCKDKLRNDAKSRTAIVPSARRKWIRRPPSSALMLMELPTTSRTRRT
jgi:hypothetical protein